MSFEDLGGRVALLRTWRKDGSAVDTPVWFALTDGRAYVVSRGPGKVRRIRRNPRVEIGSCTSRGRLRGTMRNGRARVVDGDLPATVRRAFRQRYGPLPAIGRAMARLLRRDLWLLEIEVGE